MSIRSAADVLPLLADLEDAELSRDDARTLARTLARLAAKYDVRETMRAAFAQVEHEDAITREQALRAAVSHLRSAFPTVPLLPDDLGGRAA